MRSMATDLPEIRSTEPSRNAVMELSNYSLDGMEKSLDLSLLTFPEKLWELVNDSSCKEIVWNHDGKSLVIPSIQNFISEVLNNPAKPIFKTKNFSSFVRQLNLYGFRKMSTESRKYGRTVCSTKCQFKHPSFIKGERELLQNVSRRYEPPRIRDGRKVNAADFKSTIPFVPVGMSPVIGPLLQPWAWSPFYPSYHDQLSCPSSTGCLPLNQQPGYNNRNAQAELQPINGAVMPFRGYQGEYPTSLMANPGYPQFNRETQQLHQICAEQNASSIANTVYSCSHYAKCSKGQDPSGENRALSVPRDQVPDQRSGNLRPTVVVINNTPQVRPRQMDIQRVSSSSRNSVLQSPNYEKDSAQSGKELYSSNSNDPCKEKLFKNASLAKYQSKDGVDSCY